MFNDSYASESDSQRKEAKPTSTPFKTFLSLTSFVASIGISLAVSAAMSLATCSSFMGRDDADTLASLHQGAKMFTWSAVAHGMGLVLSLLVQLLFTSPQVVRMFVEGQHMAFMRKLTGSLAWVSLGLVGGGIALVGEGLKVIDVRAGSVLQWIMLGFGLPIFFLWTWVRKTM